ncbi:MAG: lipopolysaccharide biosynthesis protein [Blastopirellula sp.]|nr:MAG: lipopolysaccharide biosynthesis protein [Blastopirellula sp.]
MSYKPNNGHKLSIKRVAHIAYSLNTGGMEKLLVEFARHHSKSKFSLHVFSLTDRGPLADKLESVGCKVTTLNKKEGFHLGTVWSLSKELRRCNISVVHTHNSGALIYGAFATKLNKIPCAIHTRHGQRTGASLKQTYSYSWCTKLIDQVVGVSKDSTQMSLAEGVAKEKVRTIWNGVDLDRYKYNSSMNPSSGITVGRLVPEKDHSTLLKAISIVRQHHPRYTHDIIGDGPLFSKIKNEILRLNLQNTVRLLGERSDIPLLLRQASFFVLPSQSEGISLTLLEAMATGLPTIATNVGGNPEVVLDKVTGILVPPNKPVDLANAMMELIQQPKKSQEYGKEGRRRVERCFDVRSMVGNYENLYEEVLSKNNSAPPHRKQLNYVQPRIFIPASLCLHARNM